LRQSIFLIAGIYASDPSGATRSVVAGAIKGVMRSIIAFCAKQTHPETAVSSPPVACLIKA